MVIVGKTAEKKRTTARSDQRVHSIIRYVLTPLQLVRPIGNLSGYPAITSNQSSREASERHYPLKIPHSQVGRARPEILLVLGEVFQKRCD